MGGRASDASSGVLGDLVEVGAGRVTLHDARTARRWSVEIEPFLLGRHPVTRALFANVNDAPPTDSQEPAVDVSWFEAVAFCNLASERAGFEPSYVIDGEWVQCRWNATGFRLPTEAQWEFACRAGSDDARYDELDAIAWYSENASGRAHPVGGKRPNAWGLHDMLGNVWEWCWDHLDPERYATYRVFRGGGWADPKWSCRASCRRGSHPSFRIDDVGFRLARPGRPP